MKVLGRDAVGEPAGRAASPTKGRRRATNPPQCSEGIGARRKPRMGVVTPERQLRPKRCGALAKQRCDPPRPLCHNRRMHRSFVAELAARRAAIKQAWERQLRHEPVTSPLANPDTLVLLMDRTLEDLVAALSLRCRVSDPTPARSLRSGCLCGLNPFLAYFRVAASILPGAMAPRAERCPELDGPGYAACVQELLVELQNLAAAEIRSFCATCQTGIARGGRAAIAAQAPSLALAR